MRTRPIATAFALLVAASSCSKCDSCRGSSGTADGGDTHDGAAPTTNVTATTAKPSASAPPMETNFACRTLARAITQKACECPQKNNAGCCAFGAPTVANGAAGPTPYVECSKGRTDWPADFENRLCKVGEDEKKRELLMACFTAKERLRCGKTAQNDLGVEVPRECETLLKETAATK